MTDLARDRRARRATDEVNFWLVGGTLGSLLLFLVVSAALLYVLFMRPIPPIRTEFTGVGPRESLIDTPRLQVNPHAEWEALRHERLRLLATSAWIDESRGIARIPIDAAMRLYAANGWRALAEREALPGLREQLAGWESLQRADPALLPLDGPAVAPGVSASRAGR